MHANLKYIMGACALTIMSFFVMPSTSHAQSSKTPAGKLCAKENGECRFSGSGFVYYGAGNKWVGKNVRGLVKCNNANFGDPAPGVVKSCWLNRLPFLKSPKGKLCAKEGGTCRFRGKGTVYYGSGNRWFSGSSTDSMRCNNGMFGDPNYGVPKRCFVLVNAPQPVKSQKALFTKPLGSVCAKENEVCRFRGTGVVHYGSGNRWYKKAATNGVKCNNATFGDPAPGVVKKCWVNTRRLLNSPKGKQCARENGMCSFKGTGVVFYGSGNKWFASKTAKPVRCSNLTFGDPNYGVGKSCFFLPDAPAKLNSARGIKCATENQVCEFKRSANVYYGAKNSWVVKRFNNKKARCSNKVFGDPAPGVVKSCWAVPVN